MTEGRTVQGGGLPGLEQLSEMEAAAVAEPLKGPRPRADFHGDGLARTEHHCQFSCTQGAPGTYRETLSE